MLTPSDIPYQNNFFDADIWEFLDHSDPLVALSKVIDWKTIEDKLSPYYVQNNGRPALPIRLMAGLLILKQLENLSDEKLILQWKRIPCYQYFCGANRFENKPPCHSTELVKFRNRIGSEGVEAIFHSSVFLHGKRAEEATVNIDSTVQEKNITYPTDGKLAIKIINRLHKLAKHHGIQLRRTYAKEIKELRIRLRFFRHVKKRASAKKAVKRLRTIVGILLRELKRNLNAEQFEHYKSDFELYEKVISQKKNDSNKIYSLHEPKAYCIAKGKDHKPYEYGSKASIVSTAKGGIILSAVSHAESVYDGATLPEVLGKAHEVRKTPIKEAVCDRGYKGTQLVDGVQIILPKPPLKKDTRYQRDKKRKLCRQRAAIEPLIGHLKQHYRLSKNFLKGTQGDEINLLMSAAAWNFKKWINDYLAQLFCAYRKVKYTIFIVSRSVLALKWMKCWVKI